LPPRADFSDFRIGPYQIVDVIAEGGMGTVYAARQSKPVERDVALKVIRAGMDSKHVIARFEAERQALALMDHPNIAKVLDGGETEEGQPYFVMELIRGEPITEYCDRRRLTTRERLELFRPVCEAVQHAHQRAIIHRDLKPSNVLVSEIDGRSVPKVIDFGVAKATGRRLTQRTMVTEQGVMIGTLEYMSPEQANLTSEDVDTRTDVYSLGVILYELLTGTLPFAAQDKGDGGYEGIRRRILEEDPKRPSTRLAKLDPRSTEWARGRGTDVPTLQRQLQGDLDWIVIKALEKDRARRYASPVELAADIARHLNDEPVTARPPSTAYKARKFIRRHRLGVAAATVVTAALLAAVAGTTVGLVRARRAEVLARTETERSRKAATFLAKTLSGINALEMGRTLGSTLRVRGVLNTRAAAVHASVGEPRADDVLLNGVNLIDVSRSLVDDEILGKAVLRIEKDLEHEPALAADVYEAIGDAYANLNLYPMASNCYERGVELSERGRGRNDTATNRLRILLAESYLGLGRHRDAQRVYVDAIDSLRRTRGENARETLIATASLGWNYQQEGQSMPVSPDHGDSGRDDLLKKAETVFRETLNTMQRVLGPDDRNTLSTAHGLGLTLMELGRYPEAETILRDTVDRSTRVLGNNHVDTINTSISLGAVLYFSGHPELGEKMGLELLERSRRAAGDDSVLVLLLETKLGGIYLSQGRYDDAEPLLRHSASTAPRMLGEQNQYSKEAIASLARLESVRSRRPAPAK